MLTYRVLQVRRGLKADLPTLFDGEIGYCTDTGEVFVGNTEQSANLPLGYVPASPSNWVGSPPTTLAGAIDRMAALLVALHGGPIP